MDRNETDEPRSSAGMGNLSMNPYRLPVSGIEVHLRQPAGREELMLLEGSAFEMALPIALLENLASRAGGNGLDWAALPVTDIDAALLRIRVAVFGDLVRADLVCPAQGCGKRIDVSFSIAEFIAHHAPRGVRGVEPADAEDPGWLRLRWYSGRFRLPTGADIVAAAVECRARARACSPMHPACRASRAGVYAAVLRAIEAMAPSLSGELNAECAECGAAVEIYFDARSFALRRIAGPGNIHLRGHAPPRSPLPLARSGYSRPATRPAHPLRGDAEAAGKSVLRWRRLPYLTRIVGNPPAQGPIIKPANPIMTRWRHRLHARAGRKGSWPRARIATAPEASLAVRPVAPVVVAVASACRAADNAPFTLGRSSELTCPGSGCRRLTRPPMRAVVPPRSAPPRDALERIATSSCGIGALLTPH